MQKLYTWCVVLRLKSDIVSYKGQEPRELKPYLLLQIRIREELGILIPMRNIKLMFKLYLQGGRGINRNCTWRIAPSTRYMNGMVSSYAAPNTRAILRDVQANLKDVCGGETWNLGLVKRLVKIS